MSAPRLTTTLALAVVFASVATPAESALPPYFGGTLRLPAQGPLRTLDPTRVSTPLEAALVAATFDPLYRADPRGRVTPVLAAGPPRREGRRVHIPLREGVFRHDRRPLTAEDVVASLARAGRHPSARWLLAGVARVEGELAITATSEGDIEILLATPRVDIDHILSALPLAIVAGRRAPVGTGPFAARFAGAELRMRSFRRAVRGAAYLAELRVTPAGERQDQLRAFELGRIDASWHGASLYGTPRPEVERSIQFPAFPVLLVPNREGGALADRGLLAAVDAAIDRERLSRLGIATGRALGSRMPAPALPRARPPTGRLAVRLLVHRDDPFEVALADALVAMLDSAGFALRVEAVAQERYAVTLRGGRWDLRIATVTPPLPGRTAMLGAAFAAAGQTGEAEAIARLPNLVDPRDGDAAAPRLAALVLGRRRDALFHGRRLLGVRSFDGAGRLDVANLHLERPGETTEAGAAGARTTGR